MACRVRTRVAVVAQVTIALLAEPLQDCGTELIAIDRLRQVHLKTRSEHTRALRAGRGQGDGRHRPPQSDVEVLKLREELAPSHFGRREVAHDDVGGERDSSGVVSTRGGDNGTRELERRPKEVARELVVIDHQDVNSPQFRRQSIHRGKWSLRLRLIRPATRYQTLGGRRLRPQRARQTGAAGGALSVQPLAGWRSALQGADDLAARRSATDYGWGDREYVLGMAPRRVPVGRRTDSGPWLRPAAPHDRRG